MKRLLVLFFALICLVSRAGADLEGRVDYVSKSLGSNDFYVILKVPIKADAKRIWSVLTDYNHHAEYVPYMQKSAVLARQGFGVQIDQVGRIRVLIWHFRMEAVLKGKESPYRKISFVSTGEGSFEKLDGVWQIYPLPSIQQNELICKFEVIPKHYVPEWAVRWVVSHYLTRMVEGLKIKAEES